jgi:hypothetical protein
MGLFSNMFRAGMLLQIEQQAAVIPSLWEEAVQERT